MHVAMEYITDRYNFGQHMVAYIHLPTRVLKEIGVNQEPEAFQCKHTHICKILWSTGKESFNRHLRIISDAAKHLPFASYLCAYVAEEPVEHQNQIIGPAQKLKPQAFCW